jgi:hypothetical protein
LELFKLTQNFSREYKYTIGQDIKYNGIQMVLYIFKANSAADKLQALVEMSNYFEILKLELRLCFDLHLINSKQHAAVWSYLDVIGKQLTGWRKANNR